MKTRTTACIAALCVLALAGLTVWAAPTPGDHSGDISSRAYLGARNLPSSGVAIERYCPVAYHAVNKPVKGKAEFASDYEGVTYWFVSAEARSAFEQDPARYIPAFGGWCAFGMSIGDKFPIDPHAFKIVDGRLMLFLRNPSVDARELWNKSDERESLAKAGAHWKKVSG